MKWLRAGKFSRHCSVRKWDVDPLFNCFSVIAAAHRYRQKTPLYDGLHIPKLPIGCTDRHTHKPAISVTANVVVVMYIFFEF